MDEDEQQPAPRVETVKIVKDPNKSEARQLAEVVMEPTHRAAFITATMGAQQFGGIDAQPTLDDAVEIMADHAQQVRDGDMTILSDTLAGQVSALDALFTEFTRRAITSMGKHQQAFESYMRLAFKAQAQCRASAESLSKMHQPREQTVRHVHVYEGGQAVVAEEFHHHGGGGQNEGMADQSQAAATIGRSPALPGPHPLGPPMPIAGGQRKEAVPNARGDKPRRTDR